MHNFNKGATQHMVNIYKFGPSLILTAPTGIGTRSFCIQVREETLTTQLSPPSWPHLTPVLRKAYTTSSVELVGSVWDTTQC